MKIKRSKSKLSKLEVVRELTRILNKIQPAERTFIVNLLDDKGVDLLSEVVTNVFFNDLNTNKKRKCVLYDRFQKKQKLIGKITNKKIGHKRRKKLLVQEGGSLGLILQAALPFLTNLLLSK